MTAAETLIPYFRFPMASFSQQIRVTYGDTDQMGIVYHANYLNYFEVSRTEMMRSQGLTYRSMEAAGVLLQVVHCEIDFHRPAHYDDLLEVRSVVSRMGKASLVISSEVWRGKEHLVTGKVKLASVSRQQGRIIPLPQQLIDAVQQFYSVPDGTAG